MPIITIFTVLFRKIEAHFTVAFWIVAPVFSHFHKQKQMHILCKNLTDFFSCRLSDSFDRFAFVAKHDLFLTFALDIDDLLYPNRTVLTFCPTFSLYRRGIRQFFMQTQIKFLAGNLRSQLAHW